MGDTSPDSLIIAGHGTFNHGTKTGEIHLAYTSVLQGATPAQRSDMILYSSNTKALADLTTCTAQGGTILYLSCHSGAGGIGEDNIVKATVRAAKDTRTPLTVIGAPSATNLKSITFPAKTGSSIKVEYTDCTPLEISSAPYRFAYRKCLDTLRCRTARQESGHTDAIRQRAGPRPFNQLPSVSITSATYRHTKGTSSAWGVSPCNLNTSSRLHNRRGPQPMRTPHPCQEAKGR